MVLHAESSLTGGMSSALEGIGGIVAKLGHSEEGVRVRALKSILFKLENRLVDYEQLWQVGLLSRAVCTRW
jgi:hypothetical protein